MGGVGLKAYVAALAALSLALAASWAYSFGLDVGPRHFAGAAVFGALLALAELFPVRVGERSEISALDVGLVGAVVLLGPLWAALAALPCAVVEGDKDPLRTCYASARNAAEVLLAGAAFSLAAPPLISLTAGDAPPTVAAVYATLAAAAALLFSNKAIDAGLLKAKYGQPFEETWREVVVPYLPSDALSVLTAGFGVLALLAYGPAAAVVLVAGSIASQALVLHAREQAKRGRELEAENLSLRRSLGGAGTTFGALVVGAMGRKDGLADRKAAAAAAYAADIASELKLGEERAGQLRLAGLLHDVGMAYLPEELLLAGDKPNSVAQKQLAEHPALGEEALAAVPEFGEMARWVRWHHERPDGRGYPDKLRGPWIPLEAKVLAVAQAYAAMVLDGPRRPGVTPREARERLLAGVDTEFDGPVVKAFVRILDTETEGYRSADDHRFVLPGRPGPRGARRIAQAPGAPGEDAAGAPS